MISLLTRVAVKSVKLLINPFSLLLNLPIPLSLRSHLYVKALKYRITEEFLHFHLLLFEKSRLSALFSSLNNKLFQSAQGN